MNSWEKKYGAKRRAIDKAYLQACEESIPPYPDIGGMREAARLRREQRDREVKPKVSYADCLAASAKLRGG